VFATAAESAATAAAAAATKQLPMYVTATGKRRTGMKVELCRLSISKHVLKAPTVSALETRIS